MVDFKKFLFDNFVVGEEKEEAFSEENFDMDMENEQITNLDETEEYETLQNDAQMLNGKEVQPLEKANITAAENNNKALEEFEEKLKQAREQGHEEGYQAGFSACKDSTESQEIELLRNIERNLKVVFAEVSENSSRAEKTSLELLSVALRKIVPNLLEENAKEIVAKFLKETFESIKNEPKLSFYIHPSIIGLVQNDIAELARVNDFEGKISLHKDATLQVSDCRIEWENGGVERKSDEILNKVENFLGSNKTGGENDE
ncbi:MAG: hypothetical protein ACK5N8_08370 [Alphaproteobacteria bacterium]